MSDQQAGPFPLPRALGPIGMPGCSLRVALDALFTVVGTGNAATLCLPVPVDNSLLGTLVYQQGIFLDPGFNAAGLTVSNSARITLGRL